MKKALFLTILLFSTLTGGYPQAASILLIDQDTRHISKHDVTYVFDGDTFALGDTRIRVWGIDTPEKGQPYAEAAKKRLKTLLNADLQCIQKDIDKYGRVVAQCKNQSYDIGAVLVAEGFAKDFTFFSKGFYKPEERNAQKRRLNIWSE